MATVPRDVLEKLLDDAITTLWAALAHDEAVTLGRSTTEVLARLRNEWVPSAEGIVEMAEELLDWSAEGQEDDVSDIGYEELN